MRYFPLFTKIVLPIVATLLVISLVSFIIVGEESAVAFGSWILGAIGIVLYIVVTIVWFLCGLAWNLYRIVENKANSSKP